LTDTQKMNIFNALTTTCHYILSSLTNKNTSDKNISWNHISGLCGASKGLMPRFATLTVFPRTYKFI